MMRLLLLILITFFNRASCKEVTALQYELKPPVFHLDDFDRCMVYGDDAFYCSVMMQLEPENAKNTSTTWKIIEELIKYPSNYRHDHLRYGVCVPETCPEIPKSAYAIGDGTPKLHKALGDCYTRIFKKYELKSKIMLNYCEDNKDVYEVDSLDMFVLYIFLGYIILIATASIYWASTSNSEKKIEGDQLRKILLSVAIQKQWAFFLKVPTMQPLASIEGIRVLMMTLVLIAHTFMSIFASPIRNTKAIETVTKTFIYTIVSNGAIIIHANFLIAGLLLSLSMLQCYKNGRSIKIVDLLKGFFKRCQRLIPLMLISILFHMTWLRHVSRGPNWFKMVGYEYENCRNTWWANIFFINNYYNPATMCFPHSWYIACDTQLFAFSLIVLYFAIKFKKYQFYIFIFASFMGYLVPGLVHYIGEYDITLRYSPEAVYRFMIEQKEWHRLSIPAESNMGAYMQGLLFGYIYYKYKNSMFRMNAIFGILLSAFLFILFFGTIYSVYPFYNGYEYSRIGAALYHSISRNLIATVIGITVLTTALSKNCLAKKFLEFPLFQLLGKLSYCSYIFHIEHLRIFFGKMRQPFIMHADTLISKIAGDILIAYFVALLAFLIFDGPINALFQLLTEPNIKAEKNKNKNKAKKIN